MRIIIYTGKGGVGKTSVAAAAALRAANLGHRTVIISTDAAHSLSDVFDTPLGHQATEVTKNLFAIETNVYTDLENNWGAVRAHISKLLTLQGLEDAIADEAAILPGMDELFSLSRIKELNDSGKYDCIIVDAAPTGETLRLLALPQTLSWSMKLLKRADRFIIKPFIRPLSKLSPELEEMLAPEEVFEALDKMLKKLLAMKKLLSNTELTSIRLVMNPEKMVVNESKRALTYLNMYGLLVDAVVVNRLLAPNSGYLEAWRDVQQRYLEEIKSDFSPLPIHTVPYYAQEIKGLSGLTQLSEDLYGQLDPSERNFTGTVFEIVKRQGEYQLRVRMPMLDRSKLRLRTTGTELILQVDNQRRVISLPNALAGYRPAKANYEHEFLVVNFVKQSKTVTQESPEITTSDVEPVL